MLLAIFWVAEASAVTPGHVDDFEDGTTQGWQEGDSSPNPPANVANGGPMGASDNFIENVSTGGAGAGSKQVMFNTSVDWTGDFAAAGITVLRLDVRVDPNSEGPLQLRLAFRGTNGATFLSADPVEVAHDGIWQSVDLPFAASAMTQIAAGATFSQAAAGVTQLRLMHRPSGAAWQGVAYDGLVGYDNISALSVASYTGWMWETGVSNFAPLAELQEENCFGQMFLGVDSDDNWNISGSDACTGRLTTNSNPARTYVNYDQVSDTIPVVEALEARSTRPLVSAGGNLSELIGEDVEMGVGQGEARLATMLASPSTGDLLMVGGYDGYSDPDYSEQFGFVNLFVKDSPDTRAARVASDLEGRWYSSFFARFIGRNNVDVNIAQTGLRVLDLQAEGVCSYAVPAVIPDPEVINNGDLFTSAQIAFAGGVDLGDRGVFAGVTALSRSACSYEIDADGHLSIDFTMTDNTQEPPEVRAVNFKFVVSDDNRYAVNAPDPDGVQEDGTGLVVGYRAPSALGIDSIDGTYLFYLNVADQEATGAAHTALATGPQLLDFFARGRIEFDSTTQGTVPQGLSGDWYFCDVELVQSGAEYQANGEPGLLSVTTSMDLVAESEQIGCAFNLSPDGSLLVNLTVSDPGEPVEEALFAGYVNDNGELITLVDFLADIENPESAVGGLKDLGSVRHILAMEYAGNLSGNEDDDRLTNFQEFLAPLPPVSVDLIATPALVDSGILAGQETWSAVTRDPDTSRFVASVHRLSDSSSVAGIDLGFDLPVAASGLDDDNPAADSSLVVLAVDVAGTPRVRKYRLSDGALLRATKVFQPGWQVFDLAVLEDMNGDGVSEYAVLGRNLSTGENAAQVRSGSSGSFIKNVFFLNPAWLPRQLVVLSNFAGGPAPELGLLATNAQGQIVVMVKDAGTNVFIKNVFFLSSSWSALGALSIPGFAGSSADEIGLGAVNLGSGRIVVMVKDAGTNAFLNNVFPLSSNWDLISGLVVADETGNGASELVALGVNKVSGKIVVQVRDAATNNFIRNLSPLGSNWTPNNMLAYGSGAGQRFVVVAERKSDQLPVVQTIEAVSGDLVSNVFLD